MVNRLSVRLLMALFGLTGMCSAQVFTDRAAWLAAVPRNATIDFTTAAPPPTGSYTT